MTKGKPSASCTINIAHAKPQDIVVNSQRLARLAMTKLSMKAIIKQAA